MPTIELLLQLFEIRDGALYWRVSKGAAKGGRPVSGKRYARVMVNGIQLYAHRVVWAMTHGHWPALSVDHIDRIKSNNSPSNLRQATAREQRCNSCAKGIYKRGKRYAAQIKWYGHVKHLWTFDTPEEATEFRGLAESMIFGSFAPFRGNITHG